MANPDESAKPPATTPAPVPNAGPVVPNGGALPNLTPPPRADAPPIFKGSVSHWTAFKSYAIASLVTLFGISALVFGLLEKHEHYKFLGSNPELVEKIGVFGGAVLIAAGAVMIFYVYLNVRAKSYTITTRLIESETGVLVRKIDALDLGRVKHVDMKQSFLERVINVGTIEVYSGDKEEPILLIEDIPDPRPIYEKLRDAVIDLSRRRGIIVE